MEKFTIKDIAERCGVKPCAVLSFIKYCLEVGKEIPSPIPYQRQYYVYTSDDANTIIDMFKNKKRGEMAEYNYKHNWGKGYQAKYPKNKSID